MLHAGKLGSEGFTCAARTLVLRSTTVLRGKSTRRSSPLKNERGDSGEASIRPNRGGDAVSLEFLFGHFVTPWTTKLSTFCDRPFASSLEAYLVFQTDVSARMSGRSFA